MNGIRLSFEPVLRWEQALDLMRIRNECREGMTHFREEIQEENQWNFFWDELIHGKKYEAYILYTNRPDEDQVPMGYGMLAWDGSKYWMTAGLAKAWRGVGLSRLLINYITEMGHRFGGEVWIDVWEDNPALVGDILTGYVPEYAEAREGKTLWFLSHQRDRYLGPRAEALLKETRQKLHGPKAPEYKENPAAKEINEVDAISRESYESGDVRAALLTQE